MDKPKNAVDFLRRFATRAALELSQGARVKNTEEDKASQIEFIPENVEESLNIPYINREGIPLAMDIFKPIGPECEGKELPVIVSIHGGGLVTGDRKISRNISREFASRGYLVFAIEYRLAPRATVCEEFDDVCAGMDFVGKKLLRYDVDFSRIFMIADSAGAFLAIYTAAMKKSKKLQEAIGYEPSRVVFKALGLSCGMFYTNRNDILGQMLSEQFYGDKLHDENFLQYMNPEHPEIVNNLPPTFLVTSRGDFLNNYTVMYEKVLKEAGNTTKMLYYPGKDLIHTFNFSRPWLPESKDANDKMLAFFETQADVARARLDNTTKGKRRLRTINSRMENGKFANQKMWEAIQAANAFSEERLDTIAILDDYKKYTYRQMFRKWDEYGEVFTATGMTGARNARVGIPGAMTTEALLSFYALNKLGASISMIPFEAMKDPESFLQMLKEENITDLILTDYELDKELLADLIKKREELGLGHVIILDQWEGKKAKKKKSFKKMIDGAEGFFYMSQLLIEYEATPVYVPEEKSPTSLIILHRKDTEGGYEAKAFTDEELNAFAIEIINNTWEKTYEGRNRMGLSSDCSMSLTLVKQVHFSMLLNHTLVIAKRTGYSKNYYKAIEKYQINMLVAYPSLIDSWIEILKDEQANFSSLDIICLEDTGITEEKLKYYQDFIGKQKGTTLVRISKEQTKDYSKNMVVYGKWDKTEIRPEKTPGFCMIPAPGLPYAPGMMPANVKQPASFVADEKRLGRIQSLMMILPAIFEMASSSKKNDSDKKNVSKEQGMDSIMKLGATLFSANTTDYYYED